MKGADLLAEIEDILRSKPKLQALQQDSEETIGWLGRVAAVIGRWNHSAGERAHRCLSEMRSPSMPRWNHGHLGLMMILAEARADLRLTTLGPINTAIGQGYVFDYFDELRKLVAMANSDVLFIDPYLDAGFVSRYLPHIPDGVQIRLLGREKISSLLPAAQLFAQQHQRVVHVRSAPRFHDRYFIVDGRSCYQSGASFKDGGRTAPTTITQITDAFAAVRDTYETLWQSGKVEL